MFIELRQRLPKDARVLALGCRDRVFLRYLYQFSCRVTAVADQPLAVAGWPNLELQHSRVEAFVHSLIASPLPPWYDLIILRDVLLFIDPTIIQELPDRLAPRGFMYIKTYAEDDPVCRLHQFVPREFIEHVLAPLVKVEDRQYRQANGSTVNGDPPRHVIELLFQKS